MSSRGYSRYCFAIALALIAVKLWVGSHVAATALMYDDHELLNRSIYITRGDMKLAGYPFSKIAYGPLYPLVISPWLLFAYPSVRLTVVFAINAVLSAIVVFFGSLTVFRLTGTASLLVPLCLAAFPPLFQFSFYAMTENLFFPMLVLVGWLSVEFAETCRRARRSVLLLLLVVLLPLVRVPGLAVVPALLLLLWMHRKEVLRRPAAALVPSVVLLLPLAAYFLLYRLALQSDREETYLASLLGLVSDPDAWLVPLQLALSQLYYLFASTGFWVLPVCIVIMLQVRHSPAEPYRQRWTNYLAYSGVTAAGVLFFAVVHLTQKLGSDDTDFIYGRYDDPAGLLLLIAGLAGALALKPLTGFQRFVLRVVAPVTMVWVLGGVLATRWIPVNQCGLAIFASGDVSARWVLFATMCATVVSQLVDKKRWFVPAALSFVLVFGAATDREGMIYTSERARMVAYTLEASEWIATNVPGSETIGYDGSIIGDPAPEMVLRTMENVYKGMMFRTYPRKMVIVDSEEKLKQVDYLYSTVFSRRWTAKGAATELVTVWTNGAYVLYRVPLTDLMSGGVPAARVTLRRP